MKIPPNYGRLTEILRSWGERQVSARPKSRSWNSAHLLVQSAKILDRCAQKDLRDALDRSDAELSPLADPLKLNLGEHRWLSTDREESYSDWLAWILQGISNSVEILRLFGLGDEVSGELLGPVRKIRREAWSEHGRTDIEVLIGKRGLLLIEVKVKPTGSELSSQLGKYTQKLADQHVEHPLKVLLGTEAPDPSLPLFEFKFTDWRTLCQRIRRYANHIKTSNLIRAAAMLIFCGAVEQNLLGFSNEPKRLRALATINYLDEWRCEV